MHPLVIHLDPQDFEPRQLEPAVRLLRAGGLVAFPTETVYGLGANALDAEAVQRVFAAKGRPLDNPLIVHLAEPEDTDRVANPVNDLARELAARWWPGPLTMVLDAAVSVPRPTTAGLGTVAVRVPDHAVARSLIRQAGVPVAAPSANRSGRPSPTNASHVLADLGEHLDAIVDAGACRVGVESTVVDARGDTPRVLREGAITREDLALVAEEVCDEGLRASPGTRHRHYAPSCAVELVPAGTGPARAAALAAAGHRVGLVAREPAPQGVRELGRFADAADLARILYGALRAAELAGVEVLVVEAVAEEGLGRAVMDRLRRAAAAAG